MGRLYDLTYGKDTDKYDKFSNNSYLKNVCNMYKKIVQAETSTCAQTLEKEDAEEILEALHNLTASIYPMTVRERRK